MSSRTMAVAAVRPSFKSEIAWHMERLESLEELSNRDLRVTLSEVINTYNLIRVKVEQKNLGNSVTSVQSIQALDQATKVARYIQVQYYTQIFKLESRRNLDKRIPMSFLIANDALEKFQNRRVVKAATQDDVSVKLWSLYQEILNARLLFETTSQDFKKTGGLPPRLYPLDTKVETYNLHQNALNRVRALATLDILLYNTKHVGANPRLEPVNTQLCCYDSRRCSDQRDKPILAMIHKFRTFTRDNPFHPLSQPYSHSRAVKQLGELMVATEGTLRHLRRQKNPGKRTALYHDYVRAYQNIFQDTETSLLMNTRRIQQWYGPLKTKEQIENGDATHVQFVDRSMDVFNASSIAGELLSDIYKTKKSKFGDLQNQLYFAERYSLPETLERYCDKAKKATLTDLAKMVTPIGGALHDQFNHYALVPGLIREVEKNDQRMDDMAQLLTVASTVLTVMATASGVGVVLLPGTLGLASVAGFLTYASLAHDLGEITYQATMLRQREKEWFLLSREMTHHQFHNADMLLEAQAMHQEIEHYASLLRSNVPTFAFNFGDYFQKTVKLGNRLDDTFKEMKWTQKTLKQLSGLLESKTASEFALQILNELGGHAADSMLQVLKTNQGQQFLNAISKRDMKTIKILLAIVPNKPLRGKVLLAKS